MHRYLFFLKRTVAAFTFCGFAATAAVPKPKNPLGETPEVVTAGRALYNKTCTGCHGPDGSEGDRAPSLNANRRYFRLSEAAIFDAVKNGIPGTAMPSSPLADLDVWKIVAFIRNIRGTASDNVVPGDITNGMRVFTGVGGCARCHMIRGQGGTLGPDLSSIGAQITLQRLRDSLTREGPISAGYRPVRVTSKTGEVINGIARNEDAFSLQILDENNKLHLLDREEVLSVEYSTKSLMPHDYDQVLSATQLQDLIAMLSRQARSKVKIEQQGENEVGR
jgi:putative heme-binding domain-containing protein